MQYPRRRPIASPLEVCGRRPRCPAPWGEVEGQMMGGHRMNLLAQRSLSKTEPGRFADLVARTVRTPGSDLLDLDQRNDIDPT